MSIKAELGGEGELMASNFLEQNGYQIVERNYRYKHAEIDVIAQKDKLLVFVEVKTRSKVGFGFPEQAVDDKKAAKVIEGAEQYIYENDWDGDVRFDIIAVVVGASSEIQHFEDAFY